ncbi:hypothetical protein LJ737_24785 [Hymenobacter sp. 15J16-1T3B]|uniref:hypothetical protein n=1 Tax=Hymenobacter sp. 15J16-1T3B TaxID=2886941 RepID=UPI001D1162A2|nr:hypothetical protein [Hymenobacter sp. 15J16-1T3B]MCC3160477.1 hypothetical protein [Hymenobacter sp. 15J16-1T3B]
MEHSQLFTETTTFYAVEYSAHPPLLRGRDTRPLSAEEITETCELLLATAQRYECSYWLLDGRSHQGEQPRELHDWMREEYFPRVRRELAKPPCIAFLVPPFVWAGLVAQGYEQPLNDFSHGVHMGWFTDEAPALAWLDRRRALQEHR